MNGYYLNLGKSDYRNKQNGKGKFLKFIEEGSFDDTFVEMELHDQGSVDVGLLVDFDPNFPLHPNISIDNEIHKGKLIKYILQYGLKFQQCPSLQGMLLFIGDFVHFHKIVPYQSCRIWSHVRILWIVITYQNYQLL